VSQSIATAADAGALSPPAAPRAGGDAQTDALRRRGGAVALLVAPWGFVVANGLYAWATRHGGSDETGAEALALTTGNVGLFRAAFVAAMLGCLLLVPAVLAAMRLVRARAPRLGLAGGSLMIAGYVCYFGIIAGSYATIAMVRIGGPVDVFARVIDAAQDDPTFIWVFLVFVLGNIVGTALFGLALLRSRTVPRWAAIGVLAWPPLHIVGLAAGSEWFEVAGATLMAVGLAATGVTVARGSVRGS
jgi:hypothetical protein